MKGRGFSSCLFCDSQRDLILGNELLLSIVQKLYITDYFDTMLQNSKVCLKCIGRFQQLSDFCTMINLEDHTKDADSAKKCCDMCFLNFFDHEVIPSTFVNSVINELKRTLWENKKNPENEEFVCCYSCNNFIVIFNDKKEELDRLLEYFNSALSKCTVSVERCKTDDPLVLSQRPSNLKREFLDSLALKPVPQDNNNENCNFRRRSVRFATSDAILSDRPDVNIVEKPQKSRRRSIREKIKNATDNILKEYNIIPCKVVLEKLNISPLKTATVKKRPLRSKTKPKRRIKMGARIKIKQRKLKNKAMNDSVEIKREEVIIPDRESMDFNISLSATDPLTVSKDNLDTNGQENASVEENNNSIEVTENSTMQEDTIKDSTKRLCENESESSSNGNASPRKTRQSADNSKVVAIPSSENATKNGLLKRKPKQNYQRKPKKFLKKRNSSRSESTNNKNPKKPEELRETDEKLNMSDSTESCEELVEYLSPSYEIKESAIVNEESYLNESTEIEFLHPKFKNKAVIFDNMTFEDLDYLSLSTNNQLEMSENELTTMGIEDNAEYLENELIEDLLPTRSSQVINDCPIFTMDELLNEDSLVNET